MRALIFRAFRCYAQCCQCVLFYDVGSANPAGFYQGNTWSTNELLWFGGCSLALNWVHRWGWTPPWLLCYPTGHFLSGRCSLTLLWQKGLCLWSFTWLTPSICWPLLKEHRAGQAPILCGTLLENQDVPCLGKEKSAGLRPEAGQPPAARACRVSESGEQANPWLWKMRRTTLLNCVGWLYLSGSMC